MDKMDANSKILSEGDSWPEFVVPWDDISSGPTDMSRFLEKPAGKQGFIKKVNGHLATGDGKRWRFWGVGMVFSSWVPPTHLAGIVARRLSKFGINCLRLHHLDHRWPSGIIKRYDEGTSGPGNEPPGRYAHPGDAPTRELDPEAMARLDWFVYCCKQNGVYVDFNLNVTRRFTKGDGVREAEGVGYSKGITYYDERIVQLEKEYAQNLLGHFNPFTKTRYAEEPCVALIELFNENSLIEAWMKGHLKNGPVVDLDMTWRDVPKPYTQDLTERWNRHLAKKYANRAELCDAWEGDLRDYEDAAQGSVRRLDPPDFQQASKPRFADEADFYAGIEREFFLDMEAFLRGTVGVKQLIVPTSTHNHSLSMFPSIEAQSALDVTDGHTYWHPNWGNPGGVSHIAQIDTPDISMPAVLSRVMVKDRAYIVSEINESFPNDFACEMIPLVTAYALLQDWDGIFWHSYTGGHFNWDEIWQANAILHHLRMSADPMKMSQMAITGMMFHRGDVQAARTLIERRMPWKWALESLRTPSDRAHTFWLPYLPNRVSLIHRTVISDFHADEISPKPGEVQVPAGNIASDTGELVWEDNPSDGRVLLDASCHQAVIMRAGERSTGHMKVNLRSKFAAIQLASLDDLPISASKQLLLVAAARVANTGMRWTDETRTSIRGNIGTTPTRIEPVQASLTLRGLSGAKKVSLQPLNGLGQPWGDPIMAQAAGQEFTLELNEKPGTPWYLVSIER